MGLELHKSDMMEGMEGLGLGLGGSSSKSGSNSKSGSSSSSSSNITSNIYKQKQLKQWLLDRYTHIQEISAACKMSNSVLNDMLTYDKLEHGLLDVGNGSMGYVHIGTFIESECAMFRIQARVKNIKICYSSTVQSQSQSQSDQMGQTGQTGQTILNNSYKNSCIHGDKHKLSQVLRNYLSNAIKYSCDSQSVTVQRRILYTHTVPIVPSVSLKYDDNSGGGSNWDGGSNWGIRRSGSGSGPGSGFGFGSGSGSGSGSNQPNPVIPSHPSGIHTQPNTSTNTNSPNNTNPITNTNTITVTEDVSHMNGYDYPPNSLTMRIEVCDNGVGVDQVCLSVRWCVCIYIYIGGCVYVCGFV